MTGRGGFSSEEAQAAALPLRHGPARCNFLPRARQRARQTLVLSRKLTSALYDIRLAKMRKAGRCDECDGKRRENQRIFTKRNLKKTRELRRARHLYQAENLTRSKNWVWCLIHLGASAASLVFTTLNETIPTSFISLFGSRSSPPQPATTPVATRLDDDGFVCDTRRSTATASPRFRSLANTGSSHCCQRTIKSPRKCLL